MHRTLQHYEGIQKVWRIHSITVWFLHVTWLKYEVHSATWSYYHGLEGSEGYWQYPVIAVCLWYLTDQHFEQRYHFPYRTLLYDYMLMVTGAPFTFSHQNLRGFCDFVCLETGFPIQAKLIFNYYCPSPASWIPQCSVYRPALCTVLNLVFLASENGVCSLCCQPIPYVILKAKYDNLKIICNNISYKISP